MHDSTARSKGFLKFTFAIRVIFEIYEVLDNWGLLRASPVGWHLPWAVAALRGTGIIPIFLSHWHTPAKALHVDVRAWMWLRILLNPTLLWEVFAGIN